MKYNDLIKNVTIQKVIDSFVKTHQIDIEHGRERDNCGLTARAFTAHAIKNGFPETETVQGTFTVDKALFNKDDFTDTEINQMYEQSFDPDNAKDREQFAINNDLVDDLKVIPHEWSEYKDRIIDFTAKAQFVDTKLSKDVNEERYGYSKI